MDVCLRVCKGVGGFQNNRGRVLEDFSGVIRGAAGPGRVLPFLCFDKIKGGLASFSHTVSLIYSLSWSLSHILSLCCLGILFRGFFFFFLNGMNASQVGMQRKPKKGSITYVHMPLVVLCVL